MRIRDEAVSAYVVEPVDIGQAVGAENEPVLDRRFIEPASITSLQDQHKEVLKWLVWLLNIDQVQ